ALVGAFDHEIFWAHARQVGVERTDARERLRRQMEVLARHIHRLTQPLVRQAIDQKIAAALLDTMVES
ncbi:MAG: hypothetical protein L0241_31290, partial [Planctomycetia bacterium]|nr:hypothetical protein [Planctomycetia bacterium]